MESWQGTSFSSQSRGYIGDHQAKRPSPGFEIGWTEVTSDKGLIEHLFTLYFCWEYPIFLTLSKEHFLSDFQTGNPRYCSSLLVNALLALGCRFSAQQDYHPGSSSGSPSDNRFFVETKRLLAENAGPSITTVQALGLMSLHEAIRGRDSESWFYSRQSMQMAVEMGLHIDLAEHDDLSTAEQEVRAVTFWGAFTLDQ
jgi:hypothetical protein